MAIFGEEDAPTRKLAHEIGQDLYALSLEDFDERIALLKAEIGRLEEARGKKAAQRAAADSIFGAPATR
jgi:uncharacterized small protein (DUF1192 family)